MVENNKALKQAVIRGELEGKWSLSQKIVLL